MHSVIVFGLAVAGTALAGIPEYAPEPAGEFYRLEHFSMCTDIFLAWSIPAYSTPVTVSREPAWNYAPAYPTAEPSFNAVPVHSGWRSLPPYPVPSSWSIYHYTTGGFVTGTNVLPLPSSIPALPPSSVASAPTPPVSSAPVSSTLPSSASSSHPPLVSSVPPTGGASALQVSGAGALAVAIAAFML